jgi:hypothetical protein
MSTIQENVINIQELILKFANLAKRTASEIKLLAVSKTKPVENIIDAYNAGQRHFGESYAKEAEIKIPELKEKGYKDIAITILPSPMVKEIRDYPIDDDVNVYIFVAHTTGASMDEVRMLFDNADIVTACASKAIDEYADKYEPYYYGVKVPIFCASEVGRRFLDVRLEHIGKPLTTNEYPRNKDDSPHKLI